MKLSEIKKTIADGAGVTGQTLIYDSAVSTGSNTYLPVGLYGDSIEGTYAFTTNQDKLYLHTGQGWFNVAIVNTDPTFTTSPDASYSLATDATAYNNGTSTTITLAATDPEGMPITWGYSANTAMNNIAYISNDSSVYTIIPKSQDSAGAAVMPTGALTFTASDGINIASAVSSFTLVFDASVANSSNTVILPKVLANNGNERGNITDKSASPLTITETGDVSEGTFNPYYKNYSTSFTHKKGSNALQTGTHTGYNDFGFNNSASSIAYNSIGVRGTSGLVFGSNNWCWELWVHRIKHYDESIGTEICGFAGGGNHKMYFNGNDDRKIKLKIGGIVDVLVTEGELPTYEWTHLAAVRNGNALTFYMNGVATYTNSTAFSSANPTDVTTGNGSAIVGYAGSGTYGNNNNNKFDYYYGGSIGHNISHTTQKYYFAGYIGDQRIVIGSPVYTGNFTPPKGPLTITGGSYPSTTNVDTSITASHTKLLLAGGTFRDLSSQTSPNGVSLAGNYKSVGYNSGHFRKVPFGPYNNEPWSSTSQSGSAYFDGTGDKLTFTGIQLAGQSHWTVECWAYGFPSGTTLDHATKPMVLIEGIASSSTSSNNFILGYNKNNGVYPVQYGSRSTVFQAENYTVAPDFWQHIAVVNNNGDYSMYINGIKCSTTDSNPTSPAAQGCTDTSGTWVIGGTNDTSDGTYMYKGYLSDVRFVVGTAVYTGNFYPPTGPLTQTGGTYGNGSNNVNTSIPAGHTKLLLNFTDSKIIDQGSNTTYKSSGSVGSTGVQKYSIPSLEFNTVGDHLTTPYNTSHQKWSPNDNWLGYSPAPFTVECWVYLNSFDTSNLPFILSAHDGGGSPEISFDSSRNPVWKWGNTARITSSVAVALTTWTHIAITRHHGTTRMYVNGVETGSVADTTNYDVHDGASNPLLWFLGAQRENTAKRLNGYISQFRISQNKSIYPFIPLKETMTTTTSFQSGISVGNSGSDTKLIALTTSTMTDNTGGLTITNQGITASNFGPRGDMKSGSFDGDYFTIPKASFIDFSGDLTMEVWFYQTARAGNQAYLWGTGASNYQICHTPIIKSDGELRFNIGYGSSYQYVDSGVTVDLGRWYHVAVSRVSDVYYMFLDGTLVGEYSQSTDFNYSGAGNFALGTFDPSGNYATNSSYKFQGYMSNFRIVNGTGLYNKNFTVPSAEITG